MSLAGFHRFDPRIMAQLIPTPPANPLDDDSIMTRRRRERWHTIEWCTTPDNHYDAFVDWILNGCDDLTFSEWEAQDRPMAIHQHPAPPSNRFVHY